MSGLFWANIAVIAVVGSFLSICEQPAGATSFERRFGDDEETS